MLLAKGVELNGPLTSDRLILEPLTSAHAEKLFKSMQEETIYTWISSLPPESIEVLRLKWSQLESRLSPSGTEAWLNWAVRRAEDGVYVGKIDAEVDLSNIVTNLGYFYFPLFWKNGYAYESLNAVVKHFSKLQMKQIRATVTLGNDSSARLLEKLGFTRNRIIPNNDTIRGVKFDDIEYIYNLNSITH